MIKVLFDHQVFSWQRYGGISRYFANIHHAIENENDINAQIACLYSENYYIRNFDGILNNGIGKFLLSKASRRNKWNKQYSKYLIKKSNFDILHPTYYHPYFLKKAKKPFVITVHDMIHELMPAYFHATDAVSHHKRLCVEHASHIIAISETTKNDLINILGVKENRISVIHHGYTVPTEPLVYAPFEKQNDYLLYVGDRDGYKNFTTFVTAIAPLLHERNELSLICAGGGSFQIAEIELITRLNLTQKIKQISATEEMLNALYANAIAFVYPSLYEGFGLPILEAFQHKCPVIASDTPCFKEVMGNAGHYFDPKSHNDILVQTTKIVNEANARQNLVEKGTEQLLKFPMEACMAKTIEVYRKLS